MSSEGKVSILLVDDNPDKLLALERVLEGLGQNLVKAHSGAEALRILLRQDFALILLDVKMPQMDGFETAALIRQRPRSAHTPIIFVTAFTATDPQVYKAYSLGAVDCIFTPIVPAVLRGKVSVFVELHKKTEEVRKLNVALRHRAEELEQTNATREKEIAERIRAEAGLQESNAALESFSYTISHDLRAPLRAMHGFAGILLQDYAGDLNEEGRECARRIRESATRLDALIHDLLNYSRLNRTDLDLQPVLLDGPVDEALKELDSELSQAEAEVIVDKPLPKVWGHQVILSQVITNLVANAIKFVPPGRKPQVRIRAEPRNGYARVWIEDNGIGISPEYHEKIFGVFERLHGADYPGNGIGLAIVQQGVKRLGGRVGLESNSGQGCRFWFELDRCG